MYQFKYLSPKSAQNIKDMVDSGKIISVKSCSYSASPDIIEMNNYIKYLLDIKNNN